MLSDYYIDTILYTVKYIMLYNYCVNEPKKYFLNRKNLFMKEKLNKKGKEHKLYTLFTIYTSDIFG